MFRETTKLLIRADAGPMVGTGHVMRMLALADTWTAKGGEAHFVGGDLPATLIHRIKSSEFQFTRIENSRCDLEDARETSAIVAQTQPDWTLLDGYEFDDDYQAIVKQSSHRLMVMDDYCHASHQHADLVLNQNVYAAEEQYAGLSKHEILTGHEYVLFRNEFANLDAPERIFPAQARRILVTFGGADPDNWTLKTLELLAELNQPSFSVDVVLGPCYPHGRQLEDFKKTCQLSIRVHRNVDRMSLMMHQADLCITGGGTTCYELARCGVPSIVTAIADNQYPVAEAMNQFGVMEAIASESISTQSERIAELSKTIRKLIGDSKRRTEMSETGRRLFDGRGTHRIVQKLFSRLYRIREANLDDTQRLIDWRNDPEVRAVSFQDSLITMETHQEWLAKRLSDPNNFLWIVEDKTGQPIGQIRFDVTNGSAAISIVLDQKIRGRGVGRMLIESAADKLFEMSDVDEIVAQIKPGNAASEIAFRAAGFHSIEPTVVNGKVALQFVKTRSSDGIELRRMKRSA